MVRVGASGRGGSRALSTRATLALVVFFAVLGLALWGINAARGSGTAAQPTLTSSALAAPGAAPSASLRTKALYVLSVVDATGRAPDGYVGGRQFQNDTRGGTTSLPTHDASGAAVTYHEYDVNPHLSGVNRGPQRLVIGSDRSAWMTGDHYVTWTRLR